MPVVARVDGVRVEFYPNEHPPPHFHALVAEHRAVFLIETSGVVAGGPPPRHERAVRAWAAPRGLALLRAWYDLRRGRRPGMIA